MIRQIKNTLISLSIALIFTFNFLSLPVSAKYNKINASTSADNFTFKSFTGDYYITRDQNNLAKMHVVETLVAEFPNYDQNHGIRRVIPVTNQAGKNVVISNPSKFTANIKRNGQQEPYTSSYEDGNITLKIGNENKYLQGTQTYTIEYDFENVASTFDSDNFENHKYQEVYWNANGNAWKQPFGSVTANVHVDKTILPNLHDMNTCYSGKYKSKGSCKVSKTADGYTFSTGTLSRGEGLTFVIAFSGDTFTIAPKRISYLAYIVFIGITTVFSITLFILLRRYYSIIYPKKSYYKKLITPTEFLPLKGYSVAEAARLYLKYPKNSMVATALEMAIQKKIEIKKDDQTKKKLFGRVKWSIKVINKKELSPEQEALLKFMNGSTDSIEEGQVIDLESRNYSSTLIALSRSFNGKVKASLIERKDLESDNNVKKFDWKSSLRIAVCLLLIAAVFFLISSKQTWFINTFGEFASVSIIENRGLLDFSIYFMLPAYIILISCGPLIDKKYVSYTFQGLDHANYLNGLETYIKMAEADRLKFLQSVEGADTTNEGIVKLYEKLLPYAVIFGQETSWLKSLEKYYELTGSQDVTMPVWYALTDTNFHSFSESVSQSTSIPSSSSESGLSSGGGFSGGGGGGGGGGGW